MIEWLHLAALLLYGVGAAITGVSFARGGRRLLEGAIVAVLLGLLMQGAAMLAFASRWGELPLVGLGASLSTLAFMIALGTVAVAVPARAGTVGLVLFPVVVVLGAVGLAMGIRPSAEAVHFHSVWFVLHVVSAFLGYAGLTVAAAAGLMYLLQFRELKSKQFGAIFRFFPPLEALDRLGNRGVVIGFPFLTLSLVAGWAWTTRFGAAELPGGSKLLWVLVSWIVFLAAFLARLGEGRRGRRGALASVIGFVVVLVAYLVLRVQVARDGGFF